MQPTSKSISIPADKPFRLAKSPIAMRPWVMVVFLLLYFGLSIITVFYPQSVSPTVLKVMATCLAFGLGIMFAYHAPIWIAPSYTPASAGAQQAPSDTAQQAD